MRQLLVALCIKLVLFSSLFLLLLLLIEHCGATQLRPLIVSPELRPFSEPVFGSMFSARRLLIASVAT
jgi:hypothetical protein